MVVIPKGLNCSRCGSRKYKWKVPILRILFGQKEDLKITCKNCNHIGHMIMPIAWDT